MKKNMKKIFIIIVFIFIGITLASAKYVYNYAWNYYLESKEFYFESDKLNLNTKKHSLLTWDGSNISFDITNYLTESLVSDYDISYKVTCKVLNEESNYISCDINDTKKSVYTGVLSSVSGCVNSIDEVDVSSFNKTECELGGYVWNIEPIKKEMYFNLYLTDQTKSINEITVEVNAESNNPYKKNLTGIFYLNKAESNESKVFFDYQTYDAYDKLTVINNNNVEKCFTISFSNAKYTVDIENVLNYNTDKNSNISELEIKVGSNADYSMELYKINKNTEYSIDDVNIVEKGC